MATVTLNKSPSISSRYGSSLCRAATKNLAGSQFSWTAWRAMYQATTTVSWSLIWKTVKRYISDQILKYLEWI